MSLLITNIGELVTNAPQEAVSVASPGPFEAIADAAIVLDAGLVAWTGLAADAPAADEVVDAGGRAVLPGFVDSHAHLDISGEEWQVFLADFQACLDSFAVPKAEQGELFAIVESTKSDIVRSAGAPDR